MRRPGSERQLNTWCLIWDERERERADRTASREHDALVCLFRGIGRQIEKRTHGHR